MAKAEAPVNEMQTKLVEILTSIQNTIGEAKDFTLQQLPDVAQQYVMYGMVYNSAISLLTLGMTLASVYAFYRMLVWTEGVSNHPYHRGEWEGARVAGALVSGFGFLISFISFLVTIGETFLVLFAPKVWLLMELTELVR